VVLLGQGRQRPRMEGENVEREVGFANPGVRLPGALALAVTPSRRPVAFGDRVQIQHHSRRRSFAPGPCLLVELGLEPGPALAVRIRPGSPILTALWIAGLLVPLGLWGARARAIGWALIAATPVLLLALIPAAAGFAPVHWTRVAGGEPWGSRRSCREPVDRGPERGTRGSGVNRRSGPLVSRRDLLQAGVVAGPARHSGSACAGTVRDPPSDAPFSPMRGSELSVTVRVLLLGGRRWVRAWSHPFRSSSRRRWTRTGPACGSSRHRRIRPTNSRVGGGADHGQRQRPELLASTRRPAPRPG
jgi:hypothetical protein